MMPLSSGVGFWTVKDSSPHALLPVKYGVPLVAALSLPLLITLTSSLFIYKRWWRGFFSWPRGDRPRRLWGDLHRLLGVWSLWFIALIAATGGWYLVESLGGKFIAVEDEEFKAAETAGGYAKQMSEAYQVKQASLVAEHIAKQDIVITTALIPGRPAPKLVSAAQVASMKPGSVIVDLAAAQGGNCPLTEADKTIVRHGVTLVGETNLPALVAADASALYARNVLDFLKLVLTKEGGFNVPLDDDIVAACLMTQGGEVKRA